MTQTTWSGRRSPSGSGPEDAEPLSGDDVDETAIPTLRRELLTTQNYWYQEPDLLACPNCDATTVHLERVHLIFTQDYEPTDAVSYSLYAAPTAEDSLIDIPWHETERMHGQRNRGAMLVLDIVCEEEGGARHQIAFRNHKAHVYTDSSARKPPSRGSPAELQLQDLTGQAVVLLRQVLAEEDGAHTLNPTQLPRRGTALCRAATVQGRPCRAVRMAHVGDWCRTHAPRQFRIADRLVAILQEAQYTASYSSREQSSWASRHTQELAELQREWEEHGPESPPSIPSQAASNETSDAKPRKPRSVRARFPSTCTLCRTRIVEGELIHRNPLTESWEHDECPFGPADPPPANERAVQEPTDAARDA